MEKFTAKQLASGILLIALLIRMQDFFITLSYDEIWTLKNFVQLPVSKLFFDLSLPNNHPLNSILVKLVSFLPLSVKYIRLPNLLAGLGSIVLAGALARRLAGRSGALWSMFFMALNAPLAVYSVLARGYGLQIFFLLLFAFFIVKSYEKNRQKKFFTWYDAGAAVCALLAVATLPTSILYLAGIAVILWNYSGWKFTPLRSTAAAVTVGGVLALSYILLNYQDLQAARKWGVAFASCREYGIWLLGVLYHVIPGGLLLLSAFYLIKERRRSLGYVILFILIFGSAIFTNGGPERVYLPWCAFFCITAGAGCGMLQEKINKAQYRQLFILTAVVIAAAANFYQMRMWRMVNYLPVIALAEQTPPEQLLIYPASDGYVVVSNSYGSVAEQYLNSVENASRLCEMFLINSPGMVSGVDREHNEKSLPLMYNAPVERFANLPVQKIPLKRCADIPIGSAEVLMLVYAKDAYTSRKCCESFYQLAADKNKILLLNSWFGGYTMTGRNKIYSRVWYIAPGALSESAWKTLRESFSENITLYTLE